MIVAKKRKLQMKAYYSHPMKFYGTKIEKEDIAIIKKNFSDVEVINPPSYEMSEKKRYRRNDVLPPTY